MDARVCSSTESVFQHAFAGNKHEVKSVVAWTAQQSLEAVFGESKSGSARAAVHDSPVSIAGP